MKNRKMGVSDEDLAAIETDHQLPADKRLAGLVLATRPLAELNGWLEPHDLNEKASILLREPKVAHCIKGD